MSRRKEIFAEIANGEHVDGWISYGTRPSAIVRRIKRAEAEKRNAATSPERRKKARRKAARG